MKSLLLENITITGGFWKNRIDLLCEEIIPYQWDTLNNRTEGVALSHAVENFRIAAGESTGEPEGTIFQDSDVAKWIEAAAYSLQSRPDKKLEGIIDELVRLIGRSQHDNGYVNTFFTAKGIEQRWTDLVMGHELYCAGHLIEAAVAYYHASGKREFIDIMSRYVDLINREFGPEEGKLHNYDGHPEIELALYRLAEVTENDSYRELADYFVNIRGSVKNYYVGEAAKEGMIPKSRWFESDYYLAHEAVRDMTEVTGHSVRGMYLFAGMADQYLRTKDPALKHALDALWTNLIEKRMYITAGIGSQSHGERFTVDYDLPSERGYTETCASIGLVFWAWRMTLIQPNSVYADIAERALFNGALSGIALDGKSYFYVNPLEIKPEIAQYRHDLEHVETNRLGWYDCACCPTNIARLIGSVGKYAFSTAEDSIYVHQFTTCEARIPLKDETAVLQVQTDYPWQGDITIQLDESVSALASICLRVPDWCPDYSLSINGRNSEGFELRDGYLIIERGWSKGDIIQLRLKMKPRFIRANSKVQDAAGKVAIGYGPLIYCVEEFDNGPELQEIVVDTQVAVSIESNDLEPSPGITLGLSAERVSHSFGSLYSDTTSAPVIQKVNLKAIPYFQWGNRDKDGEMRIWLREK